MPIPTKRVSNKGAVEAPQSEDALQELCEMYLDSLGILYTRIPSALWTKVMGTRYSRSKKDLALRMLCVKYLSGLPDLMLFGRGKDGEATTLLVELKTQKGRLRPSQIAFAERTTIYVVRSFEDFKALVSAWVLNNSNL